MILDHFFMLHRSNTPCVIGSCCHSTHRASNRLLELENKEVNSEQGSLTGALLFFYIQFVLVLYKAGKKSRS